jgi:hypothetical protein
METNKKKQHYLWKFYLKPWTSNKKIWCKRHKNIFLTSLENIGQERYFYETLPLNETEQKFLISLIRKTPPENHFLLLQDLLIYCNFGNNPNEFIRKNGLENYHANREKDAIPFYNSIYEKDLSFLNNNDNKVSFMHFISLQYHRTKRIQERLTYAFEHMPIDPPEELAGKVDFVKTSKALSFSLTTEAMANWLYEKSNIYFIETDNEFIASDQPIINIHSGNIGNFDPVKLIELYYPITPHLALFFTDKSFCNQKIDETKTHEYNKILYEKSYEQVYALSENTLKRIVE